MGERDDRLARNEAISRTINEELERAQDAGGRDRHVRMVCECGDPACERLIAVSIAEYERVRSHPEAFLLIAEHVDPAVDRVVEETDRFVVVAKADGPPRDVAEATDPRS
ncbi:MAG TPA: hypothetical protein VE646_04165 [Actinomycetota bacterium]|jgi:hypothetical protein|nr:hypothetical protein [Actinomycetota bacterium]